MPAYEFEALPPLTDNVDQLDSATAIMEVLRRNVGIVEARSYRLMSTFDSAGPVDTGTPLGYPTGTIRLGRWRVRWQTGCTDLRVQGSAANWSAEKIKVYINGAAQADITPANTWGVTYTPSGFSDGQIVVVEVYVTGTRPANAFHVVDGVWATPVVYGTTWVAPPTVTTATMCSATALTQIYNAAVWCMNRMGMVPITARRNLRYINGPFKNPADEAAPSPSTLTHGSYPLYYGGVQRNYTADYLRVYGQLINQSSTSLKWYAFVNGTQVYASGAYGPGTYDLAQLIDVSSVLSVGGRGRLSITAQVVDAGARANWLQSKWVFTNIRTEPSSAYPYASLPTAFDSNALVAETLRDRINALGTILSAVKSRIDAATHVFNRIYAMRDWYGFDDNTRGNLDKRARPTLYYRGSKLRVRGKNVVLKWGAVSIPTTDARLAFDDYELSQSYTVIDSDQVQEVDLYLDTVPGLTPATLYELHSDAPIEWAGEID